MRKFIDKLHGEEIVAEITVTSKPFYKKIRHNLNMTLFYASDGTTKAKCTFFNQHHIIRSVSEGDEFVIYGTVTKDGNRYSFTNPKLFDKEKNR